MTGHVAQALKQASRGASSFTPTYWTGTWKQKARARRTLVFCFYDMQRTGLSQGRDISEELASQTTWEAFS